METRLAPVFKVYPLRKAGWYKEMKYYVILYKGYDGLEIIEYASKEAAEKAFNEDEHACSIIEGREVLTTFGKTRHGTKSPKRQYIHWDKDGESWKD